MDRSTTEIVMRLSPFLFHRIRSIAPRTLANVNIEQKPNPRESSIRLVSHISTIKPTVITRLTKIVNHRQTVMITFRCLESLFIKIRMCRSILSRFFKSIVRFVPVPDLLFSCSRNRDRQRVLLPSI